MNCVSMLAFQLLWGKKEYFFSQFMVPLLIVQYHVSWPEMNSGNLSKWGKTQWSKQKNLESELNQCNKTCIKSSYPAPLNPSMKPVVGNVYSNLLVFFQIWERSFYRCANQSINIFCMFTTRRRIKFRVHDACLHRIN